MFDLWVYVIYKPIYQCLISGHRELKIDLSFYVCFLGIENLNLSIYGYLVGMNQRKLNKSIKSGRGIDILHWIFTMFNASILRTRDTNIFNTNILFCLNSNLKNMSSTNKGSS